MFEVFKGSDQMYSWIYIIRISEGSKTWGFGRYLELWAYCNFEYKLYLTAYVKETMGKPL